MKRKGLQIIIIAFIAIIAWFGFWYWYRSAKDELYILPNDYTGPVIVLFNEPDGTPKEYQDGYRVYRIPETGILKTQFKNEEGWRDIKYVRNNGAEIRYLWPSDSLKITNEDDGVYVYGGGSARDHWFIVGSIADKDSLYEELDKKWKEYSEPTILREGESIGKVPEKTYFD